MIGFVNSLYFSPDGLRLAAGIGQEHRLGRWWRIPEARNSLAVIRLKRKEDTENNGEQPDNHASVD